MRQRRFVLSLLIVGAAISLVLGLTLPVIKLTRLYVWTDEHSVVSIIWALWSEDELLLATIVGLFSVVFPISSSSTCSPRPSPATARRTKSALAD